MNRPNTCANLIKAINSLFKDKDTVRLSRAMGNVIVAQMLPDGVVKGGSSLMFRYGGKATRYTRDMDTARMMELGEYLRLLETSLTSGWNGFTGKLVMVTPPKPKDVPPAYIMMPFDIKLNYCGRLCQTIRIEIGHNEVRGNSSRRLSDSVRDSVFPASRANTCDEALPSDRPETPCCI